MLTLSTYFHPPAEVFFVFIILNGIAQAAAGSYLQTSIIAVASALRKLQALRRAVLLRGSRQGRQPPQPPLLRSLLHSSVSLPSDDHGPRFGVYRLRVRCDVYNYDLHDIVTTLVLMTSI